MVIPDDIEKIKRKVHQQLKWPDYNSTIVRYNTNCFSHAIGSTDISEPKYYRLGMISGKKMVKDSYGKKTQYKSVEEVKDLFLSDTAVLEIEVDEVEVEGHTKFSLINHIENMDLQNNQHIVVLFVVIYEEDGKECIRDFHFIRYDKGKGWSEKLLSHNVYLFEDITTEWPGKWNDRLVGAFKITR